MSCAAFTPNPAHPTRCNNCGGFEMLHDARPPVLPKGDMNFDPSHHNYTTHPTRTSDECAVCGQPQSAHGAAKLSRAVELSKPTRAGDMKKG